MAPDVAAAIADGESVVVVHGVDHNNSGKYDGKKSDLDPKLTTEATDPAICGVLVSAPAGGADTGLGGAASSGTDTGLLALGGGLMLVAAGTGAVAARRTRANA